MVNAVTPRWGTCPRRSTSNHLPLNSVSTFRGELQVDGATADPCQIGIENTAIISGPPDRTAHAFTTAGFLVCVGDASTRLMNMSANNPYTYQSSGIEVL